MAINSVFTTGQVLTSAATNNFPFGLAAYVRSTAAVSTPPNPTPVSFVSTSSFTPVVNRLYRISWSIGELTKLKAGYNQTIKIRVGSSTGTIIDQTFYSALAPGTYGSPTRTTFATSTLLGTTSSTILVMTIETNGSDSDCYFGSSSNSPTVLMIEDIGSA